MARDGKDAGLDALQFRAWRAFLSAYSLVVPTLDRELVRAQGLSFNQFEVLVWVRRAGEDGLRMSDLASRVVLSPSGVTRAVDQLERMGLVERCVFEGDKRGHIAKITAEGKAELRKATKSHLEGLREHFLNHLSRADLEHLATAMEAVLEGEGSPLPLLTDSRKARQA
jgi:DNA-binding MarR family transcriptional regulator